MAFYFRAAVSSRSLHGLLLVGPEGNFTDRFLLGRLAWTDANVRLLPHLRRENWYVRHAHAPARFRNVRNLVCHCGGAFAVPIERYARHVLHVWWAIHSTDRRALRATIHSFRGHRRFGPFPRSFPPDVDHRPPAEPCEGGLADHEHHVLVVLQ